MGRERRSTISAEGTVPPSPVSTSVDPADPLVFAMMAATAAAVAAVASYFPARWAAPVNPALTLRDE